jgi:flagellar P-ring protein precursor FlgI
VDLALLQLDLALLMRALLAIALLSASTATAGTTRLKELVDVQGSRENALIGYGLVVGLTNTGDTEQVLFTMQSVAGMLGRLGVRVDPTNIRSRNVAAVMVTAKLPTFSRAGSTIDVTVSAMGNARSLQGGTLLFTPMTGADGQTYAVAQGPVQVGGFATGGQFAAIQKNSPTSGTVPSGASIERAVVPSFGPGPMVFRLKRPDFTNASRIASAINTSLGAKTTKALDAAAIELTVPDADKEDPVGLLSKLELLEIDADVRAKVVVSERTGTIVMGENVRLRPAAISHGGLRVSINTQFGVSQPNAFSQNGQTIVLPVQQLDAQEKERSAVKMPSAASVDDLVKALNAIGAPARDLIAILQALKAAGALEADVEVM